MGTLKRLVFCALIISIKMMIAESAVYSSADTALNFSQCLIEKMSEPPFFTLVDRNSMIAEQEAMAASFRSREHTPISSKILVIGFVTSAAGIILDSDVSKMYNRKETYSSALQECSISSTGYVDADFILEAQRILSILESNKPVEYEGAGEFSGVSANSASYSQTSNIGNPMIVQPSPVQNPQTPQYYYQNDRTVFENQENLNIPPITSFQQNAFNPQHAIQPLGQINIAPSFGSGMPAQPENLPQTFNFPSVSQTRAISSSSVSNSQYQNFPEGFDNSGISQYQNENLGPYSQEFPKDSVTQSETYGSEMPQFEEKFFGPQSGSFPFGFDAGRISETDAGRSDALSYSEFPRTTPINADDISQTSNEGLNIPQTKESSFIVIPPNTNQQFVPDENLSQNQQKEDEKVVYMLSNQETGAQSEVTGISMTSPASMPQEQQQYPYGTFSPALKVVVFNILTNSSKFRETFNSEISQENAINLARHTTERTFSDYDSNIISDALSVVTEEVLKVRDPSPDTFGFAMSNALVVIVERHDSSLSTDISQVAKRFLSNLDTPGQFYSQQETVESKPKDYDTDDFSMTSPAATTQEQPQYSEDTSSPTLEFFVFNILTNSSKFREIFNSEISQENAINLARNTTERTFSDYDSSIINNALSVVTEEILKVRDPSPDTFGFAMSNALGDILKRYGSSLSADPSQVAKSFLSNLDNPGQINLQQETVESQPKDYNTDEFSMTSPAVIPQEQPKYSDVTSSPTLQSIFYNVLIKSQKFRETFNSEISQENAINLARGLMERTFSGYDSNIKSDAISVVTEEVLKVRDPYPETFAFSISNAFAHVLKQHESSLSVEHSQVATSFLSNLDNPEQFNSQQETVQNQPQDYNTYQTPGQYFPQTETVEKQSPNYDTSESAYYEFDEKQDFDFQTPPLSPEDRKDEMFSIALAQYLTKSEAIRNFYCDENKSEDKVQLSYSIIKASLTDYGQHVATLAASVTSGALSELSKEGLCSNYAKTISEIVAEVLEKSGINNANAEGVARNMEVNLLQRQIIPSESLITAIMPDNVGPSIPKKETFASEPKVESSFTPVEKFNPQRSEKDNHPDLVTSPDSKGAFGNEFTHPMTLLHTSIGLSTARPNINAGRRPPDRDEKTFDDVLVQHFETLESGGTEECSTTETIKSHENGGEVTDEPSVYEFIQNRSQRRRKKKKIVPTAESGAIAISSAQSEDESKIPQKDLLHSNSPEDKFKTSRVELQPSFQSPKDTAANSEATAAEFQQNPGVTSYDSDYIDTTVAFAREVSKKVVSIIALVRSQNSDLGGVCEQMNQLAQMVNMGKLEYCAPIPTIDFLLNILRAIIGILSGV